MILNLASPIASPASQPAKRRWSIFWCETDIRVTDGMRTRFADVPAEVQPGSVFETFAADAIPGLGKKYYPLLGRLHGAVGDAWLQAWSIWGRRRSEPKSIIISRSFALAPKVQSFYQVAAPYQRSVIDRFATVAAACRMAIIEIGLPWKAEDTDAAIEACVIRWAKHDNLNTVVVGHR